MAAHGIRRSTCRSLPLMASPQSPELRWDPLRGRPVILAPGRSVRPHAPSGKADEEPSVHFDPACPFCPGNEKQTPPEVARRGDGAADGPGWTVRVFPNLFPIVAAGPSRARATGTSGSSTPPDPLRQRRAALGMHEVIVLSPDHARPLALLSAEQFTEVFVVVRDRIRAHAERGYGYTQVLVNHGSEAGASLPHPHLQLVAIDLDPPALVEEMEQAERLGECVLCAEHERHATDVSLIVASEFGALAVTAWCPWWAGRAYELLVAPAAHQPRFDALSDEEIASVAKVLRAALVRVRTALDDPPYNIALHTAPNARSLSSGADQRVHWHFHLDVRISRAAGFEMGSGIDVNTVYPAEAAAVLRGKEHS